MSNEVVCWELASHDQDKSADFFRKVFDWDVQFDEKLGFYRVNAPGGAKASSGYLVPLRKAKLPFVAVYIKVDDIEAKAKLVEEHGGLVVLGPEEPVPGSRICLFNEPSGVCFAMVEEKG